jgi:hypothetical protein
MRASVTNLHFPGDNPAPTQTLKVQNISQEEMVERHKQGICYYCDEKYSLGHKFWEQNFFNIDASTSTSYEAIL